MTATATVGVAFGVLEFALPTAGGAGTYATSSAAVALAAAAAGMLAGVVAVALFALAVIHGHLPPLGELHVDRADDLVGLALFVVNGLVVAVVGSLVRQRRVPSRRTAGPTATVAGSPTAPRPTGRPAPAGVRPAAIRVSGLVEPLTAREVEVLDLLAAGMSNEVIAASLFVSVNTVKTHLKNVYGKLEVSSRTQAAARAQELGIIGERGGRAVASDERPAA